MSVQTATCTAHCEDHYCHLLPAGHAGLHETPAYERLSTGGRRFGDLYPAGWRLDDDLAAVRGEYNSRVRELSRLTKAKLAALELAQLREMGMDRVYGGPGSKDEILRVILRREFPGEDRCDAGDPVPGYQWPLTGTCTWPEGKHSVYCVPGTR